MQVWFRNLQTSAEGEERRETLPCSSGDFKKRKGGETGGCGWRCPENQDPATVG